MQIRCACKHIIDSSLTFQLSTASCPASALRFISCTARSGPIHRAAAPDLRTGRLIFIINAYQAWVIAQRGANGQPGAMTFGWALLAPLARGSAPPALAQALAPLSSSNATLYLLSRGYAAKAPASKGKAGGAKGGTKGGAKAAPKGAKTPKGKAGGDAVGAQALKLIGILSPQEAQPLFTTRNQLAVAEQRAKDYARLKLKEHGTWQADLQAKTRLRRAALEALPAELRAAAEKEDLEPFPTDRNMYYATPPEAYRD